MKGARGGTYNMAYFGWTALQERDRCEHSIGTGCAGVHWIELHGN